MQAMEDRQFDEAYALFAPEARHVLSQEDMESLANGPFYALFESYEDLEIVSWNVN
jgi:hypothetical protein